jgi:hypothetical protein
MSSTLFPLVSGLGFDQLRCNRTTFSLRLDFFPFLDDFWFLSLLSRSRLLVLGSVLLWMVLRMYTIRRLDSIFSRSFSGLQHERHFRFLSHHSDSSTEYTNPLIITTCKQQKRDSVDRCSPSLGVGSLSTSTHTYTNTYTYSVYKETV